MRAFVLALLALAAACCCHARITETAIVRDTRPGILLSRPFGFGPDGWLTFNLSNVKVHTKDKDALDLSSFGFYLAKNTGDEIAENPAFSVATQPRCSFVGDNQSTPSLVTFQDASIAGVVNKGGQAHYEASQLELREGVDAVFFANCDDSGVPVSFDIHLEMHNVDRWGHDNFLSVGELELPALYGLMCVLFGTGLAMWCYNLRVHRANAHRIHYLMTLLGAFKVLTLAAQCGMYHYVRVTGRPDGWNIAYYAFTLTRGVFLFAVIALIGAGWSYMTPFLGDNNKKILMAVIPLQVIAEVAIIVLDEFTPAKRTWFAWRSVMHVVDIACCAAILFPIVWRIKHLREAAQSDGKLEESVKQLVMFKQFYIMVLAYIYFTRVVVFILHATLPYRHVWLAAACAELATLAFYTLTAAQFRPHAGSGYFQLMDPEVELSAL